MKISEGYGLADLHIHSSVSDGMAEVAEVLRYVQDRTRLDVIAITDHDTLAGGMHARDIAARLGYRFEVIAGAEITTRQGHILGLFLEREIPPFQPLADTLGAIHEQGGLAVAPHPLSWLTFSIGQRSLEDVLQARAAGIFLDALETANASIAGQVAYRKVRHLNSSRYGLAEVGGSDSHFLLEIGTAFTRFPGRTARELRQAIVQKQTLAVRSTRQVPISLAERLQQQLRSLVVVPGRTLRQRMREL